MKLDVSETAEVFEAFKMVTDDGNSAFVGIGAIRRSLRCQRQRLGRLLTWLEHRITLVV